MSAQGRRQKANEVMKIAIIGLGGIATNYRKSLATLQRPLTAVCDIDDNVAAKIGKEESCSAYHDYRHMLSEIKPDVVFVCLPPGAHDQQVIDIARTGAAVFVAKPVALNPIVAKITRDVIQETGIINQVGYVARYSDTVIRAKQLVAGKRIVMGSGRFMFRMAAGHPWWGDPRMSGGQVVEQSTHIIDTLRVFFGDVDEVHALGTKRVSAAHIASFEECSVINLRFTSGAIASVTSSCVAQADETSSLELVGDEIYLRLSGESKLTGRVFGQTIDYLGTERGYFRQIKRFLEAVEKNDQSLVACNYTEGVKTLAVTLAANLSMRNGRPVRVRETSRPVQLASA